MYFVKRFLLISLVFVCLPPVSYGKNNAEDTNLQSLGLEELIQVALQKNPQLQVAKSNMQGEEGVVTQSRSAYLPKLEVTGDFGPRYISNNSIISNDEEVDTVAHAGTKVSQLLVDFGDTLGSISASLLRYQAAQAAYQEVAAELVLLVKSRYYTYLEKGLLITVAEDQVDNYRQHLNRAEEYLKLGIRAPIDVSNAKVELSDSELVLRQAQYNQRVALLELEKGVGLQSNNGEYTVHIDTRSVKELTQQLPPLPSSLEDLLALAAEQRPDVKGTRKLIASADAEAKSVKGRYWPSLSAVASADTYDTDIVDLKDSWQVGVGLHWKIFSGFHTDGEMAEARASVRRFQYELREIELNASLEVNTSYLRADEKRGNVFLAKETVALAEEYLNLADGRYQSGLGDWIQYNDAQLRLSESRGTLVVAYANYLTALAILEKAIGTVPAF